MRRKILQHFSNVCCQMFLTSLRNYDLVNFVIFGSGIVEIDFLSQRCTHNGLGISPLHYCVEYRQWLEEQCKKNGVDFCGILAATMRIELTVEIRRNGDSGVKAWLSTVQHYSCRSLIETDEKKYVGSGVNTSCFGLGQIMYGHTY